MEGCHEFALGANTELKKLQRLVTQRFLIPEDEAGERLEEFEKQLLKAVLGGEILGAELKRLDVEREGSSWGANDTDGGQRKRWGATTACSGFLR